MKTLSKIIIQFVGFDLAVIMQSFVIIYHSFNEENAENILWKNIEDVYVLSYKIQYFK